MTNKTEPGVAFLQAAINAVSVILPCKNEENAIQLTIAGIHQALRITELDYEIIVVDDGSTDQTQERALAAGARVLVHEINMGYGNAIMDGIKVARYPVVAILDADGTYDPAVLPTMIAALSRHDMVVGQRQWTPDNTSMTGRIMRKSLYYIIYMLSGISAPDFNSGYRVFHKYNILDYRSLLCPTFSFTTSLTVLFLQKPYSVFFMPITYSKRIGRSKVHYIKDALRTFSYVVAISSVLRPFRINLIIVAAAFLTNLLILLVSFILPMGMTTQTGLHLLVSLPLLIVTISLDTFVNSQVYKNQVNHRANPTLP
ncbi:MAG: glycosyltransferase family 2 protein [Magnetococcales bacterium]|nr:glycosyltransferase family 2 protein [Magnetococcales bacterium]